VIPEHWVHGLKDSIPLIYWLTSLPGFVRYNYSLIYPTVTDYYMNVDMGEISTTNFQKFLKGQEESTDDFMANTDSTVRDSRKEEVVLSLCCCCCCCC
jgi:hypothetical protein